MLTNEITGSWIDGCYSQSGETYTNSTANTYFFVLKVSVQSPPLADKFKWNSVTVVAMKYVKKFQPFTLDIFKPWQL